MSAAAGAEIVRYAKSVSLFHWVVGGAVVGVVGTVKAAQNTADKEAKGRLMHIHKSLALIVAALVPARILSRLLTAAPARLPGSKLEHLAGDATHLALCGLMIGLPATGITMGYFGGAGLPFFSTKIAGAPVPNKELARTAYKAHKLMGQAIFYVVPLHAGAAVLHQLRGHRVFQRMNPFPSRAQALKP